MRSAKVLAATLSIAAIGGLSGVAHAQNALMAQTNPATGKPIVVVSPVASPWDKYEASWVYNNLDARDVKIYESMGFSDEKIKCAANVALRAGLDLSYVLRLLSDSGESVYMVASDYGVSTDKVNADVPGFGAEYVSMPTGHMGGASSMILPSSDWTASTTTVSSALTAAPAAQTTVVDIISTNPNLSSLAAAIKAANLSDTLGGAGPYTVFAPSNGAFAKLPAGTVDLWMKPENKDKLREVLTYHVVPGKIMAADVMAMTNPSMPKSVEGSTLTVKTTAPVTVNGANVTQTDIVAGNGVVHVIDTVLMPPDLQTPTAGVATTDPTSNPAAPTPPATPTP